MHIARTKSAIPMIAVAGECVLIAAPPRSMSIRDGWVLAVTSKGYACIGPGDYDIVSAHAPYDDFHDANEARREGRFQLRPFRPEDLLRELIAQLDAIGVPDWHGAEGLSLDDARAFLAGDAPARLRANRFLRRELDDIGWDDPEHPYSEWQEQVAAGDTRVSYAEFVLRERDRERECDTDGDDDGAGSDRAEASPQDSSTESAPIAEQSAADIAS